LDESGEADSREKILDLLAGKMNTFPSQLTELPENSRMMITPLEDIGDVLDPVSHVRHVSMDYLLAVSTENDIKLSRRLLRNLTTCSNGLVSRASISRLRTRQAWNLWTVSKT
jgi:hypothetical protein